MVPLLFDEHRYDLSRVGRYKYNKKLGIAVRIMGHTLAQPVVNELTGEIIAEADELLTREKAWAIEKAGVDTVVVHTEAGKDIRVVSNGMVEITDFIDLDKEELGISEKVRFKS